HANVRAALDGAIEAGDGEAAVALALGLRPLWLAGMLRQESEETFDRLLERVEVPGAAEVALLRAVAFVNTYSAQARDWNARLADRAREIGDHEAHAMALCNLF